MAALLDGTLEPGEVADVAAHLRECADCRTVTGEAARFEEEEEALAAAASKPQAASRWRTWGAAAVAAAAVAAAPFLLRPANPIGNLIDASPREYRRVEGRLSGFRWAPLRGGQRNATKPRAELELISEANSVLDRTVDDEAADARHAAGVAHLLIDQTPESLDKLASAAGDSKDARVWNDLAVARYAVAVREGRTALLPYALVAVNRAIQLDPKRADAHFNKALIYEAQGLTDAARKEWQRYLELDPSSPWAAEARDHLNRLGKPTSSLDFNQELARAAGDRSSLASLVRRFPQESRQKGDGLLVRWATAYLANDAARAEEILADLRAIGEELAATNGERLLLDTVDAIARTADRADIAAAFETYGAARKAYSPKFRDLPAAEDGFRRAAAAFHAARNPFANVAEYYAAQAAFDRNRPEESSAALTALRARLHPSYQALSAEADWILSRNANAAAYWGDGARFAERAARTFAALGETENAAWMNSLEAFALDGMGAYDLASQRRVQCLGNPNRAATILQSAALAFAGTERLDAARAFLDVAIDYPSNAELRATILTDRARLAERAGDLVATRRWLGEARTLAAELSPELREAREANIDLADAVLRRGSDPEGAIATLNRSIAFFERARSGVRLPDAYLQRARTWRVLGRQDAALEDYQAALRRIRQQQESASEASRNIEFLDVAAQTIDETIDLHLDRGEVVAAFHVADRAHAMAGTGYRVAEVPDGTAVLEYAILPDSLAIFCVTRGEIAVARLPIARATLEARVASFVRKVQTRQELSNDAKALHALLIAPVAARITAARELVIVPDRKLSVLPFAALHDGTRYLIETHSILVAPSMAAALTPPTANRQPPTGAVVISDPASARAPRLQWSRGEADAIAAIHGATVIAGPNATRARVVEAMASSTLIHYAGHANSDIASYGALLLAPAANDSDLLTASEIARLELRARPLVVLSACGTLRGETSHVAGMPSLARAFLDAGASTVVGTLWEVDDDLASELFRRFHEHLRAGEVPAGALRAAQREMLQTSEPRRSHPSSWSAVEVLSNL